MFTVPDLPFEFDALEPHIDAQTMKIHHDKHHAGYVKKLNAALEGAPDLMEKDIEEVLSNVEIIPEAIKTAVINNGGGHANHSLFWSILSPNGGGKPEGDIGEVITKTFGSYEDFVKEFSSQALTRFGSGWAWLVRNGEALQVMSTANQDSPLSEGKVPLLGLDVWEHAYYLKYQNRRPEYLEAWWNVVNWEEVDRRFSAS